MISLRPVSACRLFEAELEYIINHAEDDYIMLDPVFVDLMVALQSKCPTVKGFIILTDRQGMPQHSKLRDMVCYEDLIQASPTVSAACTSCPRRPMTYNAVLGLQHDPQRSCCKCMHVQLCMHAPYCMMP